MKKIENLAEYQQLASRTCPDLGSPALNIFHMNSGIITEVGEAIDPIKKHIAYKKPLDIVNIGEEIGDAMWYIANRARLFLSAQSLLGTWQTTNESFNEALIDFKQRFEIELLTAQKSEQNKLITVSKFLHALNRAIPDMETIKEEDCYVLGDAVILCVICELLGLDFWQILTTNIEKLQKRYPDKFTEEAAVNRDLEAEREILEKGVEQKGEN